MERRENKNPKPMANKKYNIVEVICNDERVVLMLTDHDVCMAIDRAKNNLEDYPKKSLFRRLFS